MRLQKNILNTYIYSLQLEQLSGDFVSQLQSHYLNPELADQIIKNMVFVAKVTKHLPDSDNCRLSLPWLIRKMVREANHEVVSNATTTVKVSQLNLLLVMLIIMTVIIF